MTKETAEEMSLILLKKGMHSKIDIAILEVLCERGGMGFNIIFDAVRSKLFYWLTTQSPSDIKLFEEISKSLSDMEKAELLLQSHRMGDEGREYRISDEYVQLFKDLFEELAKK